MNKTLIEWVKNPDGTRGYTLNSKTGCLNHTPEGLCLGGMFPCYAYKLANGRLRNVYLANKELAPVHYGTYKNFEGEVSQNVVSRAFDDPFYPRFWPERLGEPYQVKKPIGIFLDDMSDWMGSYWPREWTEVELQMMRDNPQHRIYTLTKQPQNLPQWSPFPDNCWVGVTATDTRMALNACLKLGDIEASIRYLSIEPMLNSINLPPEHLKVCGINWLIIGACTGNFSEIADLNGRYPQCSALRYGKRWTLQPKIEWVEEITKACDMAGIPVFHKDNLKPIFPVPTSTLRQEIPDG